MILSRNWLNEFVDLKDITDKQFNDDMTLSGSKVETIERPDENLKNVVVGKILEMKRHENSDHMWVCQIDVGQAEPVQIVTGAWNIHVGDYVPAALHGAHLPGGVKYIADFVTLELDGSFTVWDAKSSATARDKVYRLKKRQMRECLHIEIREV